MDELGIYTVQVFNGDSLVDSRGGIVAWSGREAYLVVMDEMKIHKTFSSHRARDANMSERVKFALGE